MRRTFRSAVLGAATAVLLACSGGEPPADGGDTRRFADRDFHRYGKHWYALTTEPASWEAAEAEARALGGHLVAVDSAEEQAFLERVFMPGDDRVSGAVLWIGLSDHRREGVFRWSNGEPIRYVNWNAESHEPSNGGPAAGPEGATILVEEDYVAANWHWVHTDSTGRFEYPKGQWNDVPVDGSAAPMGFHTDGPYRGIIELAGVPGTTARRDLEPTDRENPYLTRPLANMDRLFAPYSVANLIAAVDRPPSKVRVLEFGMGTGRVLMELRRRFPEAELHGIGKAPWRPDDNEGFVRKTGVHFRIFTPEEAAEAKPPVLHFHDVSDGDLGFLPSNHFDVIVSQVSFGYVERKDRMLEELWRVLRPGGVALTDVDGLLLMKDGNAHALEDFFARVAAEGPEVELGRAAGFPYLRMRKNVTRPLALRLEPRWVDFPVFRDTRSDRRK